MRVERIEGSSVSWAPRAEIALLAAETKTRPGPTHSHQHPTAGDSHVPRRLDPAGEPMPGDAFVFGNDLGQRVGSTKRSWNAAVLRANGHTPGYTSTMNLDAVSRARLEEINLHFHDLRRESGIALDGRRCSDRYDSAVARPRQRQPNIHLSRGVRRPPSTTPCAGLRSVRRPCNGLQRWAEQAAKRGQGRPRGGRNGPMRMRSAANRQSCSWASHGGGHWFESSSAHHPSLALRASFGWQASELPSTAKDVRRSGTKNTGREGGPSCGSRTSSVRIELRPGKPEFSQRSRPLRRGRCRVQIPSPASDAVRSGTCAKLRRLPGERHAPKARRRRDRNPLCARP